MIFENNILVLVSEHEVEPNLDFRLGVVLGNKGYINVFTIFRTLHYLEDFLAVDMKHVGCVFFAWTWIATAVVHDDFSEIGLQLDLHGEDAF